MRNIGAELGVRLTETPGTWNVSGVVADRGGLTAVLTHQRGSLKPACMSVNEETMTQHERDVEALNTAVAAAESGDNDALAEVEDLRNRAALSEA